MSTRHSPGHFRILYFASASSFTNKSSEDIRAPMDIKLLFQHLEEAYPGIRKAVLSSCAITLNLNYVDMEDVHGSQAGDSELKIVEGDEVAIIPPVSSG